MSSAFRNFILTLLLMLLVLGFAAWKLIPRLEDAVLKPIFNETDVSKNEIDSEISSNEEVSLPEGDVSDPTDVTEDTVLDCLIIAKNDNNHACAAIYLYASRQNNNFVLCSFPVDMCLDNSGRNVPLYDLIGSQSVDYAVKKFSALVGHDIMNHVIINSDSFKKLASVKKDLTVELPYEVKYLNPAFAVIPESQRKDDHYITLSAGKTTLSESNASGIFNSSRDKDRIDYSFQQSMALSLIKQICSDTSFVTDLVAQKKMHTLLETNMSYNDFSEMSRLIFSYSTSKQTTLTYPTTKNYAANSILIPDWASGIAAIEAACN